MEQVIEVTKKRRILKRILENTVVYNESDLAEMTVKELTSMQDKLLIKLIIKHKFQSRNVQRFWN